MHTRSRFAIAAILLAATALPAAAAPFCTEHRSGVSAQFSINGPFGRNEAEKMELEQFASALRRRGVDTDMVERWNGCLRAFVTTPSGITMQYFDPNTLEQVF